MYLFKPDIRRCGDRIILPAEWNDFVRDLGECSRHLLSLTSAHRHRGAGLTGETKHRRCDGVIRCPRVIGVHHVVDTRASIQLPAVQDHDIFEATLFAFLQIERLKWWVAVIYADDQCAAAVEPGLDDPLLDLALKIDCLLDLL